MENFNITITLHDVKSKKAHYACHCMIPPDCLNMNTVELENAYGEHLVKALYDLLRHKPFRKGLEKPRLIVSNSDEGK